MSHTCVNPNNKKDHLTKKIIIHYRDKQGSLKETLGELVYSYVDGDKNIITNVDRKRYENESYMDSNLNFIK